MDFFKEFYNGEINPAEEIAVAIAGDSKYKELLSKLSQTAKLSEGLDDEAQRIIGQYREAFEELINLHELHAFKMGFIRGAELRQATIDTNNKPSV